MDYTIKSGSTINDGSLRGTDNLVWFMLVVPIYFYILAAWFIRPFAVGNISLAYAAPLTFVTGLLLLDVPKSEVLAMLRRARFELSLCLLMALLSILSVINSDNPIRILRILFPSILPILLFVQLTALRSISPQSVERLPRHFLIAGFIFGCLPLFLTFISGGIHNYTFDGGYRYQAFFEHEAQLSVMVAVMIPLIIAESAIAKTLLARWMWIALLMLSFYTSIRIGSKTAMIISVGYGLVFYVIANLRFQSFLKNMVIVGTILALMIFLGIYGIAIVTSIDPIIGYKLTQIFEGGIENYQSIESRAQLWRAALEGGQKHWLIGTGAGTEVLGLAHAHNLVLDYFHGIGIFGAIAVTLLCGCIVWRAIRKTFEVILAKQVTPQDIRILACYTAAAIYVFSNQLSNSFGPATISALWLVFIPAVLLEPSKASASGKLRRASHAR